MPIHFALVHLFMTAFILDQFSQSKNVVDAARPLRRPIPQRYAEQRYTKPGAKAKFVRTLKRPLPLSQNAVCRLNNDDVYLICQEMCDRRSYRERYSMDPALKVGSCGRHKVKFLYDKKKQQAIVRARECPTQPPLWVSEGNSKGSAFVYSRVSGDILKFHDYVNLVNLYRSS